MTVSWPLYKWEELYHKLLPLLLLPKMLRWLQPKQCASIIGKLRSAIQIYPWGIATNLKQACHNALSSRCLFWSKGKVRINQADV
jgi:hypothetical protein